MKARDIMSSPAVTVTPETTVERAARLMLERHIICLPVVDSEGRLVGIITHSDFGLHHKFVPVADHLYRLLGACASPTTLADIGRVVASKQVKEMMSSPVITVQENVDVAYVAEVMLRNGVHRLPVMRDGELVGIITRHDLLKLIAAAR